MQLLSLTDEKLEEFLGIWNKIIAQGDRKMLDITWTYEGGRFMNDRYTLTYGEEKRELTYEQALKAKQWLERIPEKTTNTLG